MLHLRRLLRCAAAVACIFLFGSAASAASIVSVSLVDAHAVQGTTDVALIAVRTSNPCPNGLRVALAITSSNAVLGIDYDMPTVVEILPGHSMTVVCVQALAHKTPVPQQSLVIVPSDLSDPVNFRVDTNLKAKIYLDPPATTTSSTGTTTITTVSTGGYDYVSGRLE